MGKLSSLLWGAAIGAGVMYFWDPQNGSRRKATARDQVDRLRDQASDALNLGVRDLRNRARGLAAAGLGLLEGEQASDRVIAERVRSRLGFLTRHSGAVDVDVQDRRVILTGDVLVDEVDDLIAGVSNVRGVQGVDDLLRVRQEAGDIPELQGEGWLPGDTPGEWVPAARLLATGGALYLFVYGLFRRGFVGALAQLGGVALGVRALTNLDFQRLLGLKQADRPPAGAGRARMKSPLKEGKAAFRDEVLPVTGQKPTGHRTSRSLITGAEWDAETRSRRDDQDEDEEDISPPEGDVSDQ